MLVCLIATPRKLQPESGRREHRIHTIEMRQQSEHRLIAVTSRNAVSVRKKIAFAMLSIILVWLLTVIVAWSIGRQLF